MDVGRIENWTWYRWQSSHRFVWRSGNNSLFLQIAWELALDTLGTVVETVDNSFFVVQPVAEADSRSRSLDEIRDRLQADWTREQAFKAAKAEAVAVMSDVDKFLAKQTKVHLFRELEVVGHAASGQIAQVLSHKLLDDSTGWDRW